MPLPFKRSNNKSQASLDKIQGDPRDRSPAVREQQQRQQQQQQQAHQLGLQEAGAPNQRDSQYQPGQQDYNGGGAYHPHSPPSTSQKQHYTSSSAQPIPQDERYYQDQQHPAAPLNRSSSIRVPPANAYQEQAQYHASRPTVTLVNPSLQQESIAEDGDRDHDHEQDQHQPGQTQFGSSQRIRTSGPKEEKKQRSSGIRALFGGGKDKKDARDSPADVGRLSRHGSVLRKGQQAPPSPVTAQQPQSSPKFPQSPQQAQSESIASYQNAHLRDLSQEDLTDDDHGRYEQYYQPRNRPNSQYELPSQQDLRRPSVPYEDHAPQFPPPPTQAQQYQQQPVHEFADISQPHLDAPPPQDRQELFPATDQPLRDRPPAALEAPDSLRPPSQSSLGPPSPLGNPTLLASHHSAVHPPKYSSQSVQAYTAAQAAQQALAQNQAPYGPGPSQVPGGSQQPDQDMPNRDRDRQRDSRVQEEQVDPQQRYQMQDPRLRMSAAASNEQGRSTPPPKGRDDIQSLDHQALLSKYEELLQKYSKVKRYYFEREAQVTQLQNTVANQRLSLSRTSLDDAQYGTRVERLNGAIQNLAFNFRKEWRRVPNWLVPACNRDACVTGTKEMTAVGRAVISRWLFERVFQSIFHPAVDPTLSHHLKTMERALRRTPTMLTEEQRDDLLTKVTTWRLSTCEALSDVLNSRDAEAHIEQLSRSLADELTHHLRTLLKEPGPANLDGYLLPIVSQALNIAANLPLESRDICIDYYYPGTPINETFMKVDTSMTSLTHPGTAPSPEDEDDDDDDAAAQSVASDHSAGNNEEQIREALKQASNNSNTTLVSTGSKDSRKQKSGGFLGGFGGGLVGGTKKAPSQASQGGRGPSQPDLAVQQAQQKADADKKGDEEHAWNLDVMTRGQKEGKVRFAVALAAEVRGKSPKSQDAHSASNGNGEKKENQAGNGQQSAGTGVSSQGGTSGGAGTGGVNVLVKAIVHAF